MASDISTYWARRSSAKKIVFLFSAILWLVLWSLIAESDAAKDMTMHDILGFRVGMPVDDVQKAATNLEGVINLEEKTIKSKAATNNTRLRSLYVRFKDHPVFSIPRTITFQLEVQEGMFFITSNLTVSKTTDAVGQLGKGPLPNRKVLSIIEYEHVKNALS